MIKWKLKPGERIPVHIDRAQWSRGNLVTNALLISYRTIKGLVFLDAFSRLPVVGKRCCLSFCAEALGVPLNKMKDVAMPDSLGYKTALPGLTVGIGKKGLGRFSGQTKFSAEASRINDHPTLTEKQREKQLIKCAEEHGVFEFHFHGEGKGYITLKEARNNKDYEYAVGSYDEDEEDV